MKIPKNEPFWIILYKLMTPLEYMLFTMNMVFFGAYYVEAQIIAKFCLTFSQHFTLDIFADEI